MSERPKLESGLSAELFRDHYWLREELANFYRSNGISTQGGKADLANRVEAFLSGLPSPSITPRRPAKNMPSTFTRETVIGPGWRCSQELREYLSAELGRPFRFDKFMRERIAAGGGTLGQALGEWKAHINAAAPTEIEPQFEYNRFTRAIRALRPDAAHNHVAAAWKRYRSLPVSQRPTLEDVAKDL